MKQIELDLDHVNFYCPVTGEQIVSSELCTPSPATAFIYLDEIGDFVEISEEFAEINEKIIEKENEDEDFFHFETFMKAIKKIKNLIVFSITTRGMACGPVSSTVHIGIDMNYCNEEVEDNKNDEHEDLDDEE
jgi:hypothetical protein